ncbi:hypothetical protein [Flavobacterium sp. 123]|uniref:hypothetical protein n=1 Tax=Flavobacterium sp. 123 TaxID=2135627 RepID=UPI000F25C1B7|nr:hypothetical protein [Flavobacterium sp. 123]RKS98910.1 hypothetical protein C8C88_0668 [Flavobacterium sp. 123]
MKNLFIAALLLVGLSSFAQDRKERPSREQMEKFTPEQRNQLMVKKMTLDLDLNSKQQEQVAQIIKEQSAKREAMKANQEKPSSDEHFAMKNKMLDEQIAMKAKMKSVLSAEQFAKWETMKEKHEGRRGEIREHRRGGEKGEPKDDRK